MIYILDKLSIDQIAAGEVVERPLSIVKELVENAIDAGSAAITIELRGGGIDLIRVTDDGCGIPGDEVKTAFFRHATSKIKDAAELIHVMSLGFRGEALSSIAAVAKVELITRTRESIIGTRYIIEGGEEIKTEEIGCPEGTTIIVRDVFYNTPARRKFLKSAVTEGNAIRECIVQFSLSHPQIRFQLIMDGKPRVKTAGDRTLRSNIFSNFGSELTKILIPIESESNDMTLKGFIAKPEFSRGNRSYVYYFVNGRYIQNSVIHSAIMDGYRACLMNHRFPFTALLLNIPPEKLDVNVHPAKKEVRFKDEQIVYDLFFKSIKEALDKITLIPEETLDTGKSDKRLQIDAGFTSSVTKNPEPFEKTRNLESVIREKENYASNSGQIRFDSNLVKSLSGINNYEDKQYSESNNNEDRSNPEIDYEKDSEINDVINDSEFVRENIFREKELPSFRIIGQVFDTYWLIEYENRLLIIDQHAAHEKVLYERVVAKMKSKQGMSQQLLSPIVCTLTGREITVLNENSEAFISLGYEWEDFGDTEILIQAVPADFLNLDPKEVFIDMLDSLIDGREGKKPEMVLDRLATISCKAAVKGENELSEPEAKALITEMLSLDEPYHCPHGRPTTIAMSKYEFEKKFKRIL
ncbi:MAG: DNA mismatch repair endonuclease MutL [Eubacterium sp.]|nr:DNA mismatch repair endonuclease MutL [Eubacterium sp.]